MRQRIFLSSLVGLGLLVGLPASSHHSTITYFDPDISVEYKDVTAVSFDVMNPHTRLVFLAPDDEGNEVEWTASTQSANVLRRMGIGPGFINPGDKLTVTASPHRSGSHIVLMTAVAFPNGDYAVLAIGARGGLFRAEPE